MSVPPETENLLSLQPYLPKKYQADIIQQRFSYLSFFPLYADTTHQTQERIPESEQPPLMHQQKAVLKARLRKTAEQPYQE